MRAVCVGDLIEGDNMCPLKDRTCKRSNFCLLRGSSLPSKLVYFAAFCFLMEVFEDGASPSLGVAREHTWTETSPGDAVDLGEDVATHFSAVQSEINPYGITDEEVPEFAIRFHTLPIDSDMDTPIIFVPRILSHSLVMVKETTQ